MAATRKSAPRSPNGKSASKRVPATGGAASRGAPRAGSQKASNEPSTHASRLAKKAAKVARKAAANVVAPPKPPRVVAELPPRAKKEEPTLPPRAGRCVIAGRPNVGKSTLLNAILGQKLSIVAPKPGTTRSVLLGVFDDTVDGARTQIAFLDTPGLEQPKNVLGRVLVEEAQGALEQGDVILLLVDADSVSRRMALPPEDQRILDLIVPLGKPVILALNKVDKVKDKRALLPVFEELAKKHSFTSMLAVSGLRADGTKQLVRTIQELIPEGLLWEEDVLTDRPERFFVAELVREAVLLHTRQEVPHGVAVQVEEWVDEVSLLRIGVTIVVAKDSHKGILIGARGEMLKQIGQDARLGIEAMMGRKVFLRTFVKVIPGWTEDPEKVRRLTREGGLA